MTSEVTIELNWDDKDFYANLMRQVEGFGRDRLKVQPNMNEADFLAGALSAMTALGLKPSKYPASWTLGLMFNAWSLRNKL